MWADGVLAGWGTQRMVAGVIAPACGTGMPIVLCSTAHPYRAPDMPRFPMACGVPWVFIMWKKRKSCQSTSLMQVCQMTSAAEENLVSNRMQIGPRLLVMP